MTFESVSSLISALTLLVGCGQIWCKTAVASPEVLCASLTWRNWKKWSGYTEKNNSSKKWHIFVFAV